MVPLLGIMASVDDRGIVGGAAVGSRGVLVPLIESRSTDVGNGGVIGRDVDGGGGKFFVGLLETVKTTTQTNLRLVCLA